MNNVSFIVVLLSINIYIISSEPHRSSQRSDSSSSLASVFSPRSPRSAESVTSSSLQSSPLRIIAQNYLRKHKSIRDLNTLITRPGTTPYPTKAVRRPMPRSDSIEIPFVIPDSTSWATDDSPPPSPSEKHKSDKQSDDSSSHDDEEEKDSGLYRMFKFEKSKR